MKSKNINERLKAAKIANIKAIMIVGNYLNIHDKNPALSEKRLCELADKIGVKYAFSNLAFEVWLISHFQKCDKQMDVKQHEKELTAYLNSKKAGLTYDKTSEEQLKKYFIPYYETAVENAKIVFQK